MNQTATRSLPGNTDTAAAADHICTATSVSKSLQAAWNAPVSYEWIQEAWDAAPDGILLVNAVGRIVSSNAAMSAISGYTREELHGQPIEILLQPEIHAKHIQHVRSYFAAPKRLSMGLGKLLQLVRKDGAPVPVEIALGCFRPGLNDPLSVAFVRDVSDVHRLEGLMQYQATHDTLTGLSNRWKFTQQLHAQVASSQARGTCLSLLLIDLDNFKCINDGYGHAAGDAVLQHVAARLREAVGSDGELARLGGDEFAVLLPDTDAVQAQAIAARMLQALVAPCRWNEVVLESGASIGVAVAPVDSNDPAMLMRYADIAMYRAKERGRGHAVRFECSMNHAMAEKVLLAERLRLALAQGGLELHYQPQIAMATGELAGAEALLRWHDPVLGAVQPERFIPVAEASGLILAIGHWVLDVACQQIAHWLQQGQPLRVAVNLSPQQLSQPDLVQWVQAALERHQIPPQWLELEVTESQAMQDPQRACQMLTELAELGVGLALDDFGSGHSSLAYLQDFPVQRLKLGQSFLKPRVKNTPLLGAIIHLGHEMGMQIIAEGVETTTQRDALARWGCEYYQGWLCSKAMPADALDLWRAQQR